MNLIPLGRPISKGSLVVLDNPYRDHLARTCETAAEVGFTGPLSPQLCPLGDRDTFKLAESAAQPRPIPAVLFRQVLAGTVRRAVVSLLKTAAVQLDQLQGLGVQHCAINLSVAATKAGMSRLLVDQMCLARPESQRNFAATLASPGQTMIQGAIDLVDEVWSDPLVQLAKKNYDEAVTAFESQSNSVVVAAGNDGQTIQELALIAGAPLRAPANFTENLLANSETTTVGAFEVGRVAAYSSDYQEVDLYADGRIRDSRGTSFAAPRVAAVMAQMHGTFPALDSAEIERRIKRSLCDDLPDQKRALNDTKCQQFLSRYC